MNLPGRLGTSLALDMKSALGPFWSQDNEVADLVSDLHTFPRGLTFKNHSGFSSSWYHSPFCELLMATS